MDIQSQIATINKALAMVLDAKSSPSDRRHSETLLQSFKDSDQALPISIQLVSSSNHFLLNVRLFGLHSIEYLLSMKWNTWDVSQQTELRNLMISLITSGLKKEFGEEPYQVKEKIAKIIVSIALRTWPQHWPDFWSITEMLLRSNEYINVELALLILTQLVEDIFIFTDHHISDSRKVELKSTLLYHSQQFWPSFVNFLIAEYAKLLELGDVDDKSTMTGGNEPVSIRYSSLETIFINGLKLCAAFSEFVPLSLIAESSFTSYLAQWLAKNEKLFIEVLHVLNVLVLKIAPKVDEQISLWRPIMDRFSDFRSYAIMLSKDPFKRSNYELLKSLSQFVCEFGQKQICAKKSVLLDQCSIAEFFNIVLLLLESDSDYLSAMTIPFWLSSFKQEKLVRNATFFSILPQLVANITNRLLEVTSQFSGGKYTFKNPNQANFYALDFDNDEEYNLFISCSKNRYLDILRAISRVKPLDMSLLVLSAVDNFSKLNYDILLSQSGGNVCSLSSEYYINLEAVVSVLETILSSTGDIDSCFKEPSESNVRETLVSRFHSTLGIFIAFNRPDPLCLAKIVEAVFACCLFLKNNLKDIVSIYNYIFPLISFTSSFPNVDKDFIATLKRKSASTLVKLALSFSEKTMPYFTKISQQIQILLSSPSLGLSEKASLIEFLLIIVQDAGTEVDRSKCYEFVFLPIVQEWQKNPAVIKALESFDSFRSIIGLDLYLSEEILNTNPSMPMSKNLEICESSRVSILYLCNVSLVVLKRLTPSTSSASIPSQTIQASEFLLELFLPRILTIIKYIHHVWNFKSWMPSTSPTQALSRLLELSNEEKRVLLSGSKFPRNGEEPSMHEALEVSLRIWINNIRLCCYSIVGASSHFGKLFIEKVPMNAFLPSLFQDLSTLQLRFVKHFIQTVAEPVTLNCPMESMRYFLSQWFPQLVSYMGGYLSCQWEIYGKQSSNMLPQPSVQNIDNDSEDSIIEVLVFERILRQATHAMTTYLFNIFIPMSERQSLVSKTHSLETTSPLIQFIFSEKNIYVPLIRSLLLMMGWKDSTSCDKAIAIGQRIVMTLVGHPEFSEILGNEMLLQTFKVLNDAYHVENHESLLSLISSLASNYKGEFEKPITGVKASNLYQLDENISAIKSVSGGYPLPPHLSLKKPKSHFLFDAPDSANGSPFTIASASNSSDSLGLSTFF